MRKINLGNVEVRAQGTPWALLIYQREFSTAEKKCSWYEDYAASQVVGMDDDLPQVYKAVAGCDAVFLLKTLWVCAYACEDVAVGFDEWVKGLEGVSMAPFSVWKMEVLALINAELFRIGQEEAKQ